MKHLGDICKINGAEIEIVDVITGGSPCQDLSIAGKRAGLAGARSGLFMAQIRIVKEMRVHDAQYWGVPQRRRRISVVADFGGDTAGEILFERKSVSRHPTESGTAREGFAEAAERGFNPAVGDCMTAWDCQSKRIFDTNGKSPTLQGGVGGGVNNPAIFAAIPINDKATRWQGGGESRNHDGSGNGLGIGKEGDPSPTLTAGDRHGVMCMTPWDAQSQRVYDGNGVSPTLSSRENSGLNREAVLCAGFKAGQGAQAGGIGYSEEVSPTLAAAPSGTNQTPAVVALDMSHACDVIRDCGEIVPSLQARMGTGGNQVPLTYQMQGFGDYRAGEVASSCKQRDFKDSTDLVCAVDCRNFREGGETNGTLQAKSNGGISYNLQNTVRTGMIVRRLTPMECERLQGFPDGWTDIGEWRDSKGKLRKPSDSPRYKALGNSIALPFWDFLAKRISAQYLRPVTMGSLFDGIGGFPLVFERHNGKGTARWASEIEEFPIAVTKLRFGED